MAARRADGGLAELADQLEELHEGPAGEVLVHERRVRCEAGEVRARGEGPLVGGAQYHASRILLVPRPLEGLDQALEKLRRERVAGLGVAQRDRRDAPLV